MQVVIRLSQPIAKKIQRDKSTISRHIKNVYTEGELIREATVANFTTVQTIKGFAMDDDRLKGNGGENYIMLYMDRCRSDLTRDGAESLRLSEKERERRFMTMN